MRATPCLLFLSCIAAAAQTESVVNVTEKSLPEITANDNRLPAGRLHNGVLTIGLEVRTGIWYPEERDGPGLQVQAFAEPRQRPEWL